MSQEEEFVKSDLDRLRHSGAHILAQAVKRIFPEAKLAIGPAIKDGFYYDFDMSRPFTEEDLPRIEEEMKGIVREHHSFVREEMSREEALEFFKARGEKYKCEILEGIKDPAVSIYKDGEFIDLCRGPHVEDTGKVKAIKLLSIAGAYWRGNERNPMLQRVYGTAFPTGEALEEFLKNLEEAKKRDHRQIGKDQELFSFQKEAPGIPFFHPRGMAIYESLIGYWREEHEREGYLEIRTPLVLREELWRQSGHFEHYQDHMYFTKIAEQGFAIRPMNCPGGLLIYKSTQRSYRDLPLRLAELGLVHRHELSGVLHGLFRVKAFTIDDAHIYCTEGQIEEETIRCIGLIRRIYAAFGFTKIGIELSTRPKDSMGSDEIWEKATQGLKGALTGACVSYSISEGAGAFYGPKIDFHVEDCLKRTWQCGTVQLDFSMPERFNLEYISREGSRLRPVMIHRACFGSVERFLGILIEHFGGAFPVWLSPEQVRIATISEKQTEHARSVYQKVKARGIRVGLDVSSEKINFKVREAELLKIPYLAVIGDREMREDKISVRARGRKDLGSFGVDEFISRVGSEIQHRVLESPR